MGDTRILALDHGSKRIGVALSDELGWTAQPLETFVRKGLPADVAHIRALVEAHAVEQVLVGLPLRLNGEEGPAARAVREFAGHLERALPVPVVTWDERLTTKEAEDLLIAADVSRRRRRDVVDRVAAAILLQSYLEHCSEEQPPTPKVALPTDGGMGDEQAIHTELHDTPPPDSVDSFKPPSEPRRRGVPRGAVDAGTRRHRR
jgi:putative Holliday junction resolvase